MLSQLGHCQARSLGPVRGCKKYLSSVELHLSCHSKKAIVCTRDPYFGNLFWVPFQVPLTIRPHEVSLSAQGLVAFGLRGLRVVWFTGFGVGLGFHGLKGSTYAV